ncbi:MAG: cell division protein SepF [Oscillospiraceae bacterium]|jgi:cell division inhibitor SepF|nr:cell division protein SepF [Oscillospiraceae bacterium]MCI8758836.1 cell division protein SepF [Oscillospiraceae bacterium]MCI9563198.1 cell division protein SepF [Oscillospiraceae bacterium]
MSWMENIKRIISPISDEDDDYDEAFDDQESPFVEDRPRGMDRGVVDSRRGKVVNIHATTQLKVVLVKPERFENASEIADHLKEKRTVVVNLESTHKDIARRLIDFLSGVAYAGEGKIKRVAANTYIITPYSVEIQGDLIDELENNFKSFS